MSGCGASCRLPLLTHAVPVLLWRGAWCVVRGRQEAARQPDHLRPAWRVRGAQQSRQPVRHAPHACAACRWECGAGRGVVQLGLATRAHLPCNSLATVRLCQLLRSHSCWVNTGVCACAKFGCCSPSRTEGAVCVLFDLRSHAFVHPHLCRSARFAGCRYSRCLWLPRTPCCHGLVMTRVCCSGSIVVA